MLPEKLSYFHFIFLQLTFHGKSLFVNAISKYLWPIWKRHVDSEAFSKIESGSSSFCPCLL